jgi:hypothetical protein
MVTTVRVNFLSKRILSSKNLEADYALVVEI